MKATNISVCGNDFDLSEPPKTAPNPFFVSSVRFGRVSDMRENHSVAVDQNPSAFRRRGGAFQFHALNSSIMGLGLENFWAKRAGSTAKPFCNAFLC